MTSEPTNVPQLDPKAEAPQPRLYAEVGMTENEYGTSVWQDYEKVTLLADSGTGEIWLCHRKDQQQQQQYVIKSIDKAFLSGMFAKELKNEVDVLRQLDHPHIVRIYETYEDRNAIHLVQEYCALGDLATKPPQSEEEVAMVLTQVLSAVVYCHQHKVVHRDLKLGNIVWASENAIKLIDFGYAQQYTRKMRGEYRMQYDIGTVYHAFAASD